MFKRISGWLATAIGVNLVLVTWCAAATFYVRNGATGSNNGSDWNNAWRNTSNINYAALNPGDTVYIAGGTYSALNISKGGAAGKPLTFKRATKTEPGTATGWSDAYDQRVVIDGGGSSTQAAIAVGGNGVQADHVTIDGATRYGIWVRNAYYGVNTVSGPSQRAHNLTLRYLEIGDTTYRLAEDGIQGKGNNLTVENCYIHDNDSQQTHGDNIQWFEGNTITLRYNVFKNGGQMFKMGEEYFNTTVSNVNIYYNVFYNRGGGHYNGMVFAVGTPNAGQSINIYNNTFDLQASSDSGYDSLFYPLSGAGTVNFKNNAVIATNASQVNNTVHANNAYDNSGGFLVYNIPSETGRVAAADLGFVNATGADYRLTVGSPLAGKGANVGLTRDFEGKAVPATPSIGAFESGTVVAVPAPTNLTVN